eukprot:SAG31_NODE_1991_length_6712_cov_6.411311_2_plen_55_part_00
MHTHIHYYLKYLGSKFGLAIGSYATTVIAKFRIPRSVVRRRRALAGAASYLQLY